MIWYVVAFFAGMIFMWKVGLVLLNKAFKTGWQLEHTLKALNADSFAHLRKKVDAETNRRNTLI